MTRLKVNWLENKLMPRSHIHGSPRRYLYGLNLTDDPGNANFRSPIRMHYIRMIKYYYGCYTESYGPIRIATNDAGLYPWLILRPVRECVTWALTKFSMTTVDLSKEFFVWDNSKMHSSRNISGQK